MIPLDVIVVGMTWAHLCHFVHRSKGPLEDHSHSSESGSSERDESWVEEKFDWHVRKRFRKLAHGHEKLNIGNKRHVAFLSSPNSFSSSLAIMTTRERPPPYVDNYLLKDCRFYLSSFGQAFYSTTCSRRKHVEFGWAPFILFSRASSHRLQDPPIVQSGTIARVLFPLQPQWIWPTLSLRRWKPCPYQTEFSKSS